MLDSKSKPEPLKQDTQEEDKNKIISYSTIKIKKLN